MSRNLLLLFVLVFIAINPVYSQIQVSGDITTNTTWNTFSGNNVYVVVGDVTVTNGVTLTIQAGAIIKFQQYYISLNVYGVLDIQGTSANKVVFTSFKDDNYGGDTNGDLNATQPNPGDWARIYFESQPGVTNTFDYCIVKYGGGYHNYGPIIQVNSGNSSYSDVSIQNCTISNSGYSGIYVTGYAEPAISNNDILFNSTFGLFNETNTNLIAENNYWGASTGPYHPTLNPTGQGNAVSDNVDFQPFSLTPINYTAQNSSKIVLTFIQVKQQGNSQFIDYELRTALGIRKGDEVKLKGKVFDLFGFPVPNVEVKLYNSMNYDPNTGNNEKR